MLQRRPLLMSVVLIFAVPVFSAAATPPALSLEERLQTLEDRQSELYHTLTEKKEAGPGEVLSRKLTLSGLLEVEGTAVSQRLDDGSRVSASDLSLATVQLGLDAAVSESTNAKLVFLYEEGGIVEVDEATIELSADGGWQGRIGRQYLPFGTFHSHFISDPLTLTLGEIRQTAFVGGYAGEVVRLQLFAFNGDAEQSGSEDHINDWGGSVAIAPVDGVEIGASYLSDLADSSLDILNGAAWTRRTGGWSAYTHAQAGAVTVEAEYLAAVRSFAAGDLDTNSDGRGDRPRSWNVEAAWSLTPQIEIAARLAGSRDLAEQPRRQYGGDLSWSPRENTTLSFEYLHSDYATGFAPMVASNVIDSDERLTVQLAVAF